MDFSHTHSRSHTPERRGPVRQPTFRQRFCVAVVTGQHHSLGLLLLPAHVSPALLSCFHGQFYIQSLQPTEGLRVGLRVFPIAGPRTHRDTHTLRKIELIFNSPAPSSSSRLPRHLVCFAGVGERAGARGLDLRHNPVGLAGTGWDQRPLRPQGVNAGYAG